MRRFLRNVILFLLPCVLTAALFIAMLAAAGEYKTVDSCVQAGINGENALFELTYTSGAAARYKQLTTMGHTQNLLVLGTSRSMQFTAAQFPSAEFYNAGGAVSMLGHFRPFLQALPQNAKPDTLILCLDQFFFNANWDDVSQTGYEFTPTDEERVNGDMFMRIIRDFSYGKINPVSVFSAESNVIGIGARCRKSGFLPDGSYCYGNMAYNVDCTFPNEMRQIDNGEARFMYADTVNPAALQELRELLKWCADNEIKVVAYLPPYAPSVWERMRQTGKYGYIDELRNVVPQICGEYGVELYDFTCMENTADEEFYDGYHAGDRVYAKMALEMLRQNSCVSQYTSEQILQNLLIAESDNSRLLGA